MVLNLKKSLDCLKESKKFKDWKENSKQSYLADGFVMFNEDYDLDKIDWQIDFYNKDKGSMTSFIVKNKEVSLKEEQEVLKKENETIEELDLNKIKINLKDAIAKVKNKYPNENPNKIIIILQNIKVPLWNITFLTHSFKILNVKINAENAEILEESLNPIFEIKKK